MGAATQGGAESASRDSLSVEASRPIARDDSEAYREHERTVMAMLASRYADVDPDGRRELYHEAWASVLHRAGRYFLCGGHQFDRHTPDQEQLHPIV